MSEKAQKQVITSQYSYFDPSRSLRIGGPKPLKSGPEFIPWDLGLLILKEYDGSI